MPESQIIGFVVIGLTAIVGLFLAIYKPLNDNTKAMTILTVNIETLTKKIDEQNKRIDEQERNLEKYKNHVSESQKRQWDVIDKHGQDLLRLEHNLELCKQQNKNGGVENV